jgi:hypothetical protein
MSQTYQLNLDDGFRMISGLYELASVCSLCGKTRPATGTNKKDYYELPA